MSNSTTAWTPRALLARAVDVTEGETAELLWSFAIFFSVLSAYYILRPIRDEMGVTVGSDGLERLFTVVFFVMLAAVPLFGWITTRFPRRRVAPIVYGFFILNLLLFWLALSGPKTWQTEGLLGQLGLSPPFDFTLASLFFVWASVFNLFVVSMFWILMSDIWETGQAKRLYGFIAAGGTAGALAGPLVSRELSRLVEPHHLLLVSAGLLTAALLGILALRRAAHQEGAAAGDEKPAGEHGVLEGARRVFAEPYLFRIALFILLANLVGTYFYLEQSRIVGEAIPGKADRVHFFATRDLAVSVLVLTLQVLVTGRIMKRFGLGVPLAALPATATVGLLALSVAPSLDIVAAVMVAERAISFALANPAIKVLYTAVSTEDKYKAQSFIDTVVYRGGDAASGWVFNTLAKSLGLSGGLIAVLTLPVAGLWLMTARDLARMQKEKSETAAG